MTFGVKLRLKTVKIPYWWDAGHSHIARNSLTSEHPESRYQWFKRHFPGVNPEDFGIFQDSPARKMGLRD